MANFFRSVLSAAAALLQNKTVTAGTSNKTVTFDSGYDGLGTVTVEPTPTETASATPSTAAQTLTPTSGKYFSSVTVGAVSLSGDAAAGNVLSGKTFYKDSLTKQTGSMTNNGAVSQALNCGGSYTVPEGYHDGTGTVTANSLASQTGVDSGKTAIDASHVHSGYQGWVNGSKVSGSYTEPIINSIAPSNTAYTSAELNVGENYTPTRHGYAVEAVIPITPSSTPKSLAQTGYLYRMLSNCVVVDAMPTINSITPSDSSPASMSSGSNYSPTTNGYAIENSPTTLTPNNSSPPSIASGTIYKGGGSGYAISSYSSVTPSTSGASFSSGMVKMESSGYAYSAKPTASFSWTPLWTNSSPTSNFAGQTLTIPTVNSYTYLKIEWKRGKSLNTIYSVIVPKADLQQYESESTSANAPYAINGTGGVSRSYRLISLTQFSFGSAYKLNQSGSDNSVAIPTAIYGGNLTTN